MKDQFNDYDLTDPELKARRDHSPESQRKHENKLIRFAAVAATLYSLLHKLFIPLLLKITTVTKSPYKEIDLAWVVPVFFLYSLYSPLKYKRFLMPVGCGASIALGFFELYRYIAGENVGWLVMSRFISSGPLAFLGVLILVRIANVKKLVYSWLTTFLVVWGLYSFEHIQVAVELPVHANGNVELQPQADNEKVSDAGACGLKNIFWKDSVNAHLLSQDQISLDISECGFSPAIQIKNEKATHLVVSNNLIHSVNVHLWIFSEKGQKRKSKNFILPPLAKNKEITFDGLKSAEQVLVVSDTTKELGVAVLVDEKERDESFKAQSDPPRLEVRAHSQEL